MDNVRRERIRNQAAVKQCKRFVAFTDFSNYSEIDTEIDPEIELQEQDDLKYNTSRDCLDGRCGWCESCVNNYELGPE